MSRLLAAMLLAAVMTGAALAASKPRPSRPGEIFMTPVGPQLACPGACGNGAAPNRLSMGDVERVIAQAVGEARARNAPATIAVVDRVGNVLAVFTMHGAPSQVTVDSGRGISGGLEGLEVIPATLAAIAKAITGAYLSSSGNAFTSRTASQIVQQHFNPGETGQPGGPLFGVQFSQLPCSDLSLRFTSGSDAGPKRSPLGLSADAGGMPLYKDGEVVGGVGIVADPVYGLDLDVSDWDVEVDELIALAGGHGYAPPPDIQAGRITVEGKTLRFADVFASDLLSNPASATPFSGVDGVAGDLTAVTAYSDGTILGGTAFGEAESGVRSDPGDYPGLDAFVLVDDNQMERYPPMAGTDGPDALTEAEVLTLMREALDVSNRARAQIRRPLGDRARVTVSIVDSNGVILAIARSRDAPVFGIDVSLQKARTAAFFSNAAAAADLASAPNAIYRNADGSPSGVEIVIADYVQAARVFLGSATALADGAVAFSDRAGGNLSRPYYPDGIAGNPNGPFSKPIGEWSPFSVGLQLDLALNRVVQHVVHVLTDGAQPDSAQNCTAIDRLPNGIQIFPGSVPIYRGATLVGGIGVSGDGIDQDDMVSFLGLHQAGLRLGTINNAPPAMRADQLAPRGARLRFVQCPYAPFNQSDERDVCAGK